MRLTILDVMSHPDYFGPWFGDSSWDAWRAFLAGVFGLPMTAQMAGLWQDCTRRAAPTRPATEAWMVVGRRGGKSRIAALIAVYLACFRDYRPHLAPGEVATLPLIAADRREARTIMRYVKAYLDVPALRGRVVKPLTESIELADGVQIEVHTASFRAIRGYTVMAAICDEIAFWNTDDGAANPDSEVLAALRPGMASIPGAMLLALSSPYARSGALWNAYETHFGHDHAEVVWQADTRTMNPTIDPGLIESAYTKDPDAAAAEYGAQFRRDIEGFVSREAVAAVVVRGRLELPPVDGVHYVAFVDPSGGSHDSMTLAIAHRNSAGRPVLDCVRERRPPFNPGDVVSEFAALLRTYRCARVTGDRYGGEWVPDRFRHHVIDYVPSERTRSEYYLELLPLLNGGGIELLDQPRLIDQVLALERRTARGGRDSVDHPPGGHDDVINAAAGALITADVPAPAYEYTRVAVERSRRDPDRWGDDGDLFRGAGSRFGRGTW